ncbi:MAG: SGNH/GDSL hydrolase family protein [Pseudoruegeria sp.]
MKNYFKLIFLASGLAVAPVQSFAETKLDVLILGDSQISFGAGEVYLDFFDNLQRNCAKTISKAQMKRLGQRRTLAVGVRSTSLHSWVARDGRAKDTICEVDKKYGVNAGAYGIAGQPDRKFIQIGKEPGFQYCRKNESALEVVFNDPANTPKLLVLNVLGNAEKRWSESQSTADTDVRRTLQQIPKSVPCIVLTTAPVFHKTTNDTRMLAQNKLARALEKAGGRCHLVKGISPETRAVIEGKSKFFRQNKNGKIVDPHHPSKTAIKQFMKSTGPKLCEAVAAVLK